MKSKIILKFFRIIDSYISKYLQETEISDSYIHALIHNNDYFYADLDKCVDPYGYSYGGGWHFFTSMVKNMDSYSADDIISNFETFLRITYHKNVREGLCVNILQSYGLKNFSPPCLPFLTPWSPTDVEQVESRVQDILGIEELTSNLEFLKTNPLINPNYLAKNHYARLHQLRKSFLEKGYQFTHNSNDPVKGFVLSRQEEYRILIFSGQHRVATLSGLNYKTVPVKFVNKYIISAEQVSEWPLVKNGLWSKTDALAYFNHMFDFDSPSWAIGHGLLT